MQDVWTLLSEWRRAAQHLDSLPVDSPEWQLAVEEVARAHSAYRAQVAQATARDREAEFDAHRVWRLPAAGAAFRATN